MAHRITAECTGCGACRRICPVTAIEGERKSRHSIDAEACIDCGACGRTCPAGAVTDGQGRRGTRIKRSEWSRPEFLKKCVSCNACVQVCPVSCIEVAVPENSRNQHPKPILVRQDDCIGCGFCERACPVSAIRMKPK
jgi:Na+-translocating ferredoxin:NAD+ oxidoreductase subunit B